MIKGTTNLIYDAREQSFRSLQHELFIILESYKQIYDEYYETCSRDSAFLKDLTDSLLGISAVLEVYARDKQIHPNYVLEKLEFSKSMIDSVIKYYKGKLENEESDK